MISGAERAERVERAGTTAAAGEATLPTGVAVSSAETGEARAAGLPREGSSVGSKSLAGAGEAVVVMASLIGVMDAVVADADTDPGPDADRDPGPEADAVEGLADSDAAPSSDAARRAPDRSGASDSWSAARCSIHTASSG